MPEEDTSTICNLCTIGLFSSFLWGGTVYFFKNILLLSISWSLLCAYIVFSIIAWIIFKCSYCKKKEDNKINDMLSLEPPEYVETENNSPPDYNSSTEEII